MQHRFGSRIKNVGKRLSLDLVRKPRVLLDRPDAELRASMELVAAHLSRYKADITFVEIGANDGVLAEGLVPIAILYGWAGVLVEPQAAMFAKLRQNVADHPRIRCVNAAVDAVPGQRTLYRVADDADVPDWAAGSASFEREHLLRHRGLIPNIDRVLVEERVRCLTFDGVLEEAQLDRFDILQIDCEGFDYEILKLADLPRRKPAIVNFEHVHLSDADWNAAVSMLLDLGYRVAKIDNDTLAYRFNP